MTRRTATRVASGLVAGSVMALWATAASAMTGAGLLTPLNAIAHSFAGFLGGIPLDGTFDWLGSVVGALVHLLLAALFGALFALMVPNPLSEGSLLGWTPVLVGPVYGALLWLVDHVVLWPLIDSDAAAAFTLWISFVGHLLYGLVLGSGVRSAAARPTRRMA